jgi:hypothetical protein
MPDNTFGIERLLWSNARRTKNQLGQSNIPSIGKSQSFGTHRIVGATNATAGQNSNWSNHIKHEAEAPFAAISIKIFGRETIASNGWSFVVAPTSTGQTTTTNQLFRPTTDGVSFNPGTAFAGSANPDGWRPGTWSGTSSANVAAGSTFFAGESPWSDWIPCRSVPRTDVPAGRPLSMLRVYHDGTTQPFSGPSGTFSTTQWNSPATSALDYWRLYQSGIFAGNSVTTLSNEPGSLAGSGFWIAIRYQYLVPRVRTLVVIADSIGESNGSQLPGNNFGAYAMRACARASTQTKPICFINAGVSGVPTDTFLPTGLQAANFGDVTDVLFHAGSPNDGPSDKFITTNALAKVFQVIQYCKFNKMNLFLATQVVEETYTAAANAERVAYNATIRNLCASGFATLVDIDAATSANTFPLGTYIPSMKFDTKHPNDAGMDAESVLLTDALLSTW